eukprot:5820842-Pyramimonas_sp.AAC.1
MQPFSAEPEDPETTMAIVGVSGMNEKSSQTFAAGAQKVAGFISAKVRGKGKEGFDCTGQYQVI